MPFIGPSSQNSVDHPTAIAPLASVVQTRLHLKLLDNVRAGQRRIGKLAHVIVCGADTFNEVVVVVTALAVDVDADSAAAELLRVVESAGSTARQRQQLLKIPGRQRQARYFVLLDRLARGRVFCVDRDHFRGNFDFLRDAAGL